MKNKRFWLLSACFTILNTLLANAVIFDEPRSSGRYFGGYGFGVSLMEMYDSYYSFIDFFLFLLIFGGLTKTVFKGEEKHNNALAIGLATALSLGLTLYLDNEGIRLFDLGPWIAGLAILMIIALVWNFIYKKLGHGKWLVASLITLALVLLGVLITTAIRGEGAGSAFSWSVAGGISFGALLWFLIVLFLIIAGVKHIAKTHGVGPDFSRPWGGNNHHSGNPEHHSHGAMPPISLVDDPNDENVDVVVKEKANLIWDCIRDHAAAIKFLDTFFYKTNNFAEIKHFLDLYLFESKIKFAKGLKMRFKDFSAYLATQIFPDFEKALSLDYPTDLSGRLAPDVRTLLSDLYDDLQDARDIYNANPVIHAQNLGGHVNYNNSWNRFSNINSNDPAEQADAATYFSDNVLTPMDGIFKILNTIITRLQRELAPN